MRVLVDSSVWIDSFNGADTPQTDDLDEILGRAPVVVGDLIVTEVLQGLADESEVALAQAALAKFDSYGLAGSEIAVAAALNRHEGGTSRGPPWQEEDAAARAVAERQVEEAKRARQAAERQAEAARLARADAEQHREARKAARERARALEEELARLRRGEPGR